MAGLKTDANGNKLVTFRYGGKQFTKSAGTKDNRIAGTIKARVETTIFELTQGFIVLPDGANAGEFIVTGGKRSEKPVLVTPAKGLTLGDLFRLYDEHFPPGAKAGTTVAMEGFHRNHLLRHFGPDSPVETMSLSDAQNYANTRSRETYRGKPILPPTISKELSTLRLIWNWALKRGDLTKPVPFRMRDLSFDRTEQKAPFQTFDEIQRTLKRGKMGKADEAALWESLYLTLEETHEVLAYVREVAKHPFIYPMFAFAALTGARRSEICRSRIGDWNLESRTVNIREMKRKRGRSSFRSVDVGTPLASVMSDWLRRHPGGQNTICKDGEPITVGMAHGYFKRTLRGSKWEVIPGFHTFRHSFASILASKGVDEMTIDKWMGHQTAEQRERYRHLFPTGLKHSIETLALTGQ